MEKNMAIFCVLFLGITVGFLLGKAHEIERNLLRDKVPYEG